MRRGPDRSEGRKLGAPDERLAESCRNPLPEPSAFGSAVGKAAVLIRWPELPR